MISKISIEGFQSHLNSTFEFTKGVNIIVGDSHGGKSSVIRALNWVLSNRPLGDSFIKVGQKQARVVVELDNGVVVERVKGSKRNEYLLTVDGSSETFTAFGSSVPEPVLTALNLSDVNVQRQHEPHFLIFDSPGSVATYLRSVTGLEDIDAVSSEIGKRLRSTCSSITSIEGEVDDLSEQLSAIDKIDLDRFQVCLDEYEEHTESIQELTSRLHSLEGIVRELNAILDSEILIDENRVDEIFEAVESDVAEYVKLNNDITQLSAIVSKLNSIGSVAGVPDHVDDLLNTSEDLLDEHTHLFNSDKGLYSLVEQLETVDGKLVVLLDDIQVLKADELQMMEDIDVCPSCGSELDQTSKAQLLGG